MAEGNGSVAPNGTSVPRDVGVTVPHIARIYDFWLGGKDNFEVDREAGRRAAEANPALLEGVRGNRAFLARAVRFLAGECGIRQFLDIGTGIPASANTHEVASPGSRVVYVDNDPVVLAHARALLSGPAGAGKQVGFLDADARDTGAVLAGAARTLDFGQPVGVMMIAMLHCLTDSDDPWSVVSRLVAAVPPGSYLALTHPSGDFRPRAAGMMVSGLNEVLPQRVKFRRREQVLAFFDGLELVEPGLVRAPEWRPDSPADAANPAGLWGGVARKP